MRFAVVKFKCELGSSLVCGVLVLKGEKRGLKHTDDNLES